MAEEKSDLVESDREIEYRKWATDRLFAQIAAERDRRNYLDSKAGRSLAFLVIFVGIAANAGVQLWAGLAAIQTVALLATAVTIVFVWLGQRVGDYPDADMNQLVKDEAMGKPVESRYRATMALLLAAISEAVEAGNRKAEHVKRAQAGALIAVFLYLLALTFHGGIQ